MLHEDPRQENTVTTTTTTNDGESSRITGVLIINSDATLITATLNNLAQLIKTRNPIAPKIVSAVLSFNPLAIVSRSNTIQNRLMMQCMEKTVRVLLLNIVRYAKPAQNFYSMIRLLRPEP